jgi:hypothetical protein
MARKKNYQLSGARREQVRTASESSGAPSQSSLVEKLSSTGDARIDMEALLGSEARFAHSKKNIDFNDWLGRGIDTWVWSALACFHTALRSGARQTSTVGVDSQNFQHFFRYLVQGGRARSIPVPADLNPSNVKAFVEWLKKFGRQRGLTQETLRSYYKNVKAVLLQMFELNLIPGDASTFFKGKEFPSGGEESKQTALSDFEQVRLANAIKADLSDVYHKRLSLNAGELQGLRLLLVGHRQGKNPTPLLELARDTVLPGVIPGTIRIRTVKVRSRKVRASVGRAAAAKQDHNAGTNGTGIQEAVFSLAEGSVLQQAIQETEGLVDEAPVRYKNRIWLYRTAPNQGSVVTCLSIVMLGEAIKALVARHKLFGDDGKPLRVNLSRLRKSFFDRSLRVTDGDLTKTSNLMGNSPAVSGRHYPSMNEARIAESAEFLNEDYVGTMRGGSQSSERRAGPKVIQVTPVHTDADGRPNIPLKSTPVSSCQDTLNGEYAPHDGRTHCDHYVYCLFCSSFAIVGTIDELWRLFSYQVFAVEELRHLDSVLGPERTQDDNLEDLRDRYRIAIPYIDQFTKRQFAARVVKAAREKTMEALHPFWQHELKLSGRARSRMRGRE